MNYSFEIWTFCKHKLLRDENVVSDGFCEPGNLLVVRTTILKQKKSLDYIPWKENPTATTTPMLLFFHYYTTTKSVQLSYILYCKESTTTFVAAQYRSLCVNTQILYFWMPLEKNLVKETKIFAKKDYSSERSDETHTTT